MTLATRLGALALLAGLTLAHAAAAAPEAVDLALVMAVDVSESVDGDEYVLQHEGIARAVEDPRLVQSVTAGRHGAIEVAVMEWSDRDKQMSPSTGRGSATRRAPMPSPPPSGRAGAPRTG